MSIPVVDMHCDTAVRLAWHSASAELRAALGRDYYYRWDAENPPAARDLAKNHCHVSLEKIGDVPWAQCFACFIPDELTPAQAVEFQEHVWGCFQNQLANNPQVTLAKSAEDARGTLDAGGVCAIRTIENARLFAEDLGLVEKLAAEGLQMASLSWNAGGPLASGHDTSEHMSATGAAALAELERCRVAIDVSHLNDECFADVSARATRPFCASHSNSRAVCGHPRNLTDDQFRAIMAAGGVTGLNYCGGFITDGAWGEKSKDVTFEQVVSHLEHWLDLGGEDAIALGGDLDGADVPVFLDGADHIPAFQERLVAHFGHDLAEKLCHKNALAFLERVQAA
ncbi:dipeptidase [Paratractidigestivibacter sp.]|uniref:dipeptidase n=2 Tax=Paratractidigestivibacter sp. TaxID=2847316 RepID=UPI002ABDE7D4|nr:membrane dipeptidase [Paratractidigestivibacter sp.]